MKPPATALLERDSELAAIEACLRAAAAGEGGLLIVEGEAGAGKTVLLQEGLRRAEGFGVRALRARGGEYEREFPYGVVRQLFEPALDRADGRVRLTGSAAMAAPAFEGTGAGDAFSVLHGLYWLVAELAEAAPLAIAVDDAQWADAASLQALLYLGRRLDDMQVALAMTVRTGEVQEALKAIDELRGEPRARLVRPAPLSVTAVTALANDASGWTPSDRFAGACRAATGGNPFLLAELFRALADEDEVDLADQSPERLAQLAATGASGAILRRLTRLGTAEADVARAVAILEPRAEVRLVAQLSGHPVEQVAEAGARLVSASLLSDGPLLAFAHPLVREAVLTDMGERLRRAAHARAARLLDADGGDLDTVAAQLLLAEPTGDEWVVDKLRSAAASAVGRGAPKAAVGYLRRALAEPPPPAQRLDVQRELGLTLLRGDDAEGIEILRDVHARAGTREERAEVAAVLSNSLMFRAQHAEAEAILHQALQENPGRTDQLGINLHLHLLLATIGGFERLPDRYLPGPDDIATDALEGRAILSQTALLYALGVGPMAAVSRFVERIGRDRARETADARGGFPGNTHLIALSLDDRGDEVFDSFPNMLAGAEQRAALGGISGTYGSRAYCHLLDGELSAAQVDAETALRIAAESGFTAPVMSWLGAAAGAMVGRGEAEAAIALVDQHTAGMAVPPGLPGAMALIGRGQAHQALAHHAAACEDFRAAAARLAWIPMANPEGIGWRPGLALSLAALGEADEASALAAECVTLAQQAGGTRGLGIARRVEGLVAESGEQSIEALRASVALLAETRARLQHAESLVALGAALRRANCRKEARDPLAEGLEIAHRCGAAPLEERARTELAATGARPRNVMRSGVEALTPSELRVAQMAAAGKTNREIAQLLVVSAKTVETHLRHVFQKLDVDRRTKLVDALTDGGAVLLEPR